MTRRTGLRICGKLAAYGRTQEFRSRAVRVEQSSLHRSLITAAAGISFRILGLIPRLNLGAVKEGAQFQARERGGGIQGWRLMRLPESLAGLW